jgi:hypothetical protein
MNLADSHYRTLETKGQEPIDRMESIVCRGIPPELHEVARRNLNMALASKHEDRAGEKTGEDWRKELTKAENYMHRAVHGCWIGKGVSDKESLTVGDTVPCGPVPDGYMILDPEAQLPLGFDTKAWDVTQCEWVTHRWSGRTPRYRHYAAKVTTAPVDEWEPIATAPKDGTWLTARTHVGREVAVHWARLESGGFDWLDADNLIRGIGAWLPRSQHKAEETPAPVDTWVEDESHWTDPATGTRYEAFESRGCIACCFTNGSDMCMQRSCTPITRRADKRSVSWRKVAEAPK